MTGRHEFRSGVTHTIFERERMSLKAVTIAQVLKSAGYTTGIFGKWHLGDEPSYQPGQRGFDEVFTHGAGGIGQSYAGSCGDAPGNTYFDPAIRDNGRCCPNNQPPPNLDPYFFRRLTFCAVNSSAAATPRA